MAGTGRIKLEDQNAAAVAPSVLLGKLAKIAWRHKTAALPALFATTASTAFVLAGAVAQGTAIDYLRIALPSENTDRAPEAVGWPLGIAPPSDWSFMHTAIALSAVILLIALIGGVARYGQRTGNEYFFQACNVDLRTMLYKKLQALGFTFFDDHDSGQIIQRLTQDTSDVSNFLQGVLIQAVISALTLSFFLVYMFAESPVLTWVTLAFIPVQVVAVVLYARVTKPKFKEHARLVDTMVQWYKESIEGVRVIRVFGRRAGMEEIFADKAGTARDYRITLAKYTASTIPLFQASAMMNAAVLLGFGGWLILKNADAVALGGAGAAAGASPTDAGITLGVFWTFFVLMNRFSAQVESIVMVAAQSPTALAGAERVFRLLEADPDVASPQREHDITPIPGEGLRGGVKFEGVSFGYMPGETVLHDVSFAVEPGETIAIVGPTGSGKSTLLSLIARFYDPDGGRVLIDGVDVRTMPVRELRRHVGFVFQEPFLFSNTVRNNVAYGVPTIDDDHMRTATNAAAASGFIDELPQGYDTIIGERGVSLSGGQRQRLTLARALLLRPDILVLDDATGSVDAVTEAHIQDALDGYLGQRTTFVVAHRLSTLRRADRIIVMEHGRIVDIGTHDELMNRPGHYKAAALIQLELDRAEAHEQMHEHDATDGGGEGGDA